MSTVIVAVVGWWSWLSSPSSCRSCHRHPISINLSSHSLLLPTAVAFAVTAAVVVILAVAVAAASAVTTISDTRRRLSHQATSLPPAMP